MSSVTIIGAPFSTFTRTMRMAFAHLNVPYELKEAQPHSSLAYKHNPFGRIPSLVDGDRSIFETAAIRDYIDTQYSSALTPTDLDERLKMDQLISILSDYVFHSVVLGVMKRREFLNPKSGGDIEKIMVKPLSQAGVILAAFDAQIPTDTSYLCGHKLTWADYYVYPVAADLYCEKDAPFFKEKTPRLYQWYSQFKLRKEAIETYPKTVADLKGLASL
ncbi:hypothetical protein BDB01DRAFT_808308 [Pilobolus umbonatus]|nr:hypothetical protein BDB01DRAFT_808308 [Pilobolus umbonatus]